MAPLILVETIAAAVFIVVVGGQVIQFHSEFRIIRKQKTGKDTGICAIQIAVAVLVSPKK